MTTSVLVGRRAWKLDRDREGHRNYTLRNLVRVTDPRNDGPAGVMTTSGLPQIGDIWAFGNDIDAWAFCEPTMKVMVHDVPEGEPASHYVVEQIFSTRPRERCQDADIEDPLLEPDRISGSFVKYTQEVNTDKDGNYIKTGSHELIRGPQVEFDFNRPTVRIEQNVPLLGLDTFSQMIDTVNDAVLWGLAARTVKLSNVSWSRKRYGLCEFYYTRTFDFDVNYNTFDRTVLDEGTKVLNGHWDTIAGTGTAGGAAGVGWVLDDIGGSAPDKTDPSHFKRYQDRDGNYARVILDGNGEPWDGTGDPGTVSVQRYSESNFLTLGIPTAL